MGIVRGMPEGEYHAVDAASNSRLSRMRGTAAHCRWAIDHPEESEPMTIGSLTDCFTFTPEAFDSLFLPCDAESKAAKAWKEAEAIAGVRKVVKHSWLAKARAMHESVMANKTARKLVEAAKDSQLSVFWQDQEIDLYCKGRIDIPLWEIGCNFDLKTTRSAADDEFQRSIWTYGYHLQAAMYEDAAASQGHGVDRFGFVLVENEPPYLSRVVELDRSSIQRGHEALKPLKEKYAECIRGGVWPGYSDEIAVLSLPAWTAGRI
jgi:hypothetical protein